jgi:3-dehydroquinate synthase class II
MLSHWATAAWAIVGAIASEMFFCVTSPCAATAVESVVVRARPARVLAIGDMHNSLKFPDTRTYPVRYGLFQDGGYHFFSL